MISWIQRYFQSHFKVIFAVLLGVLIISFVFTIGAAPGIGRADRQVVEQHFFGYNLGLQTDQQRLMGDAAGVRVSAAEGLGRRALPGAPADVEPHGPSLNAGGPPKREGPGRIARPGPLGASETDVGYSM